MLYGRFPVTIYFTQGARGMNWEPTNFCLENIYFWLSTRSYNSFKFVSSLSYLVSRSCHNYDSVAFVLDSLKDSVSSVVQLCPTLWDPMDCSMPGFPVQNQLPNFAQIHVHRVGDAVQPSHPLLSPSPPAFNCSQHRGLFQ